MELWPDYNIVVFTSLSRDVAHISACDDGCLALADLLGWKVIILCESCAHLGCHYSLSCLSNSLVTTEAPHILVEQLILSSLFSQDLNQAKVTIAVIQSSQFSSWGSLKFEFLTETTSLKRHLIFSDLILLMLYKVCMIAMKYVVQINIH